MIDTIAKPIGYVMGILFISFVLLSIFAGKMDQNVQTYCNDAVEEFVDDACAAGYIAPGEYLQMAERLGNTGNMYNITLVHQSKTMMPYVKSDGTIVQGSYVQSYNLYRGDEILTYIFPAGEDYRNYPLKNGDYLQVTISLKEPTLAARLARVFTKTDLKTISYSYGAYVGNMEDNPIMSMP